MNKSTKLFLVLPLLLLIGGCNTSSTAPGLTQLSAEAKRVIAICSGGLTSEVVGKIELAAQKNGGKLDAGIKDSVLGAFQTIPGLKSEDVVKLQEKYMECLEKNK